MLKSGSDPAALEVTDCDLKWSSVDLPGILSEIADAAGLPAALALAARAGGTEIYVPLADHLTPDHWLVALVGADAARAIARRWGGGGGILIPLGPAGSRARIWRAIAKALDAGYSAAEAARRAGVHQRTVYRHRRGPATRRDGGQGSLF